MSRAVAGTGTGGRGCPASESTLTIGLLLPEVLGTYGDTGNAWILRERARRRGIDAQILTIDLDTPIPSSLDLYTMGGGEDTAQALAAEKFDREPGLRRAVEAGRPLLAICASLQVLGHWYRDARGQRVAGLGVLDVTTDPQGRRTIGELASDPLIEGLTERLTGFENHGGGTVLGPDAAPLGRVVAGTGNGVPQGAPAPEAPCDGVVQGPIIATYMHGPALARNPQLADLLLARAIGRDPASLAPLDVPGVSALRAERLRADSGVRG
ncbi:MAG: glutamine amidotransferase [Actinomyces sp.]|jgi:CobQ-like glutamine amidotransferase family enzyme|nr:glutamine amidotransferase [Actinomyces sp.]MCI1662728.1 glutamine amidotransferase [Actinomyces sp.]